LYFYFISQTMACSLGNHILKSQYMFTVSLNCL
jgi:hypothetical protein